MQGCNSNRRMKLLDFSRTFLIKFFVQHLNYFHYSGDTIEIVLLKNTSITDEID